ncbi:MAG: ATP-binding protein [Elusimicrobiales bacterium]|nr:ATP-binding protein [Elusimicrobiales bacterium]
MLKRLYTDNYRCLVNFEMRFDKLNLLMGPNGAGKSTIFDLLSGIQRLISDKAQISEIFPPDSITAWVKKGEKAEQIFEFDVQSEYGLFSYKLVISHNPERNKQRIELERLLLDGKPLFEFQQGNVKLYHDDHNPGPEYPGDWSLSMLATIPARVDNKKLTYFKEWASKLFIVSLQPRAIKSETEKESDWLEHDGTNFASWYRYLSQEHQDKIMPLTQQLQKTVSGFYAFKLVEAGKQRLLKVGFKTEEANASPVWFDFGQLSDGQRVIFILYSLLFGLQGTGHSLFLDEPENYIALPEIQPWLLELNNACQDGLIPQVIIISHHPELIDYLGPECGKWIKRDSLGPARIGEMPKQIEQGLKLSEQIARGWTE